MTNDPKLLTNEVVAGIYNLLRELGQSSFVAAYTAEALRPTVYDTIVRAQQSEVEV